MADAGDLLSALEIVRSSSTASTTETIRKPALRLAVAICSFVSVLLLMEVVARVCVPDRQQIFHVTRKAGQTRLTPNRDHWLMSDERRRPVFRRFMDQTIPVSETPKVIFLGGSTLNGWGYGVGPCEVAAHLAEVEGTTPKDYINLSVPGMGLTFASRIVEDLDRKLSGKPVNITWVLVSAHNETLQHIRRETGIPRNGHPYEFAHKTRLPSRLVDSVFSLFSDVAQRSHPASEQEVLEHAEACLRAIVRVVRRRGERLVIGTMASNLRHYPPKRWSFDDSIQASVRERYERVRAQALYAFANEDWEQAKDGFRAALAIAGEATSYFWLARTLEASGRHDEAVASYARARDLNDVTDDPRAWSSLNDLIRAFAERESIPLLDFERLAQSASSQISGTVLPPGHELFLDNCHPNKLFSAIMGEKMHEVLNGVLLQTVDVAETMENLETYSQDLEFQDFHAHFGAVQWYLFVNQQVSARYYFDLLAEVDDLALESERLLFEISLLTHEYDWSYASTKLTELLDKGTTIESASSLPHTTRTLEDARDILTHPLVYDRPVAPRVPRKIKGTLKILAGEDTEVFLNDSPISAKPSLTLPLDYYTVKARVGPVTDEWHIFVGPAGVTVDFREMEAFKPFLGSVDSSGGTAALQNSVALVQVKNQVSAIDRKPVSSDEFTRRLPAARCIDWDGFATVSLDSVHGYLERVGKRLPTLAELQALVQEASDPATAGPQKLVELARLMSDSRRRKISFSQPSPRPTVPTIELATMRGEPYIVSVVPEAYPSVKIIRRARPRNKVLLKVAFRGVLKRTENSVGKDWNE